MRRMNWNKAVSKALPACCVAIVLSLAPALHAADPTEIVIQGKIEEDEDISAIAVTSGFLLLAADEKSSIQVLERAGDGFKVEEDRRIPLLKGKDEADLEGMAVRPRSDDRLDVFAIGCHCGNRKTVKDDKSVEKNREALAKVDFEESRASVYRVSIDARTGKPAGSVERKSLLKAIGKHPVLGPFTKIPSKENGIDIEGLAVTPDGRLAAGLRGPVLRGNFAPVLLFDFDHPDALDVRFLDLGGLGIRDLAAVKGGFLVLAGPIGDGRPQGRIFFWNGVDGIPGTGQSVKPVVDLGETPQPDPAAKAEGLAVEREDGKKIDLILVYDGVAGGRPTRFRVELP